MTASNPSVTFSIMKPTASKPLAKDDNGYYKVIVGGLNVHNSAGAYYSANGVKEIINKPGSLINRRLSAGYLVGEMGHPQFKVGMSPADYLIRLMRMEISNTSHHIKEISCESTSGGKEVLIYAWLKPAGVNGKLLEESISNPDRNTAFSIRCIHDNMMDRGQHVKIIKDIITFDWVTEPGIANANTWKTMSTEHFDLFTFKQQDIEKAIKQIKDKPVAVENDSTLVDLQILQKEINLKHHSNDIFKDWIKRS